MSRHSAAEKTYRPEDDFDLRLLDRDTLEELAQIGIATAIADRKAFEERQRALARRRQDLKKGRS